MKGHSESDPVAFWEGHQNYHRQHPHFELNLTDTFPQIVNIAKGLVVWKIPEENYTFDLTSILAVVFNFKKVKMALNGKLIWFLKQV